MTEALHFRAKVKRAGNSIAIILPAKEAKRVGIRPDRVVDVDVRLDVESPLGLFQRIGLTPAQVRKLRKDWSESKSEAWPDE